MPTTLVRKPVRISEEQIILGDVAERAKRLVGYSLPAETRENDLMFNQVQDVLDRLDIKPFTRDSVDVYCQEELVRARKKWSFKTGGSDFWNGMSFVFAFATVVALIFTIVGYALPVVWGSYAAVGFAIYVVYKTCKRWTAPIDWAVLQLNAYREPVPEFALQTACDVTERLWALNIPHQWFIRHLQLRSRASAGDPFLVLDVCDKLLYLEVWNEPGYKHQREV